MKRLVTVEEVEGEGLIALLGKEVMIWCMNYNYHGFLDGVNDRDILLSDAKIVFETGRFDGPLKDAQHVPGKSIYVRMSAIESYCAYPQ